MKDQLEVLRGKEVEIIYDGIVYRGRLEGADENEISLKTNEQWIMLPMERISSIKRINKKDDRL
ncbi:MAG: hypothetical protein ACE5EA_03230 [Nitrospirota bacterium]